MKNLDNYCNNTGKLSQRPCIQIYETFTNQIDPNGVFRRSGREGLSGPFTMNINVGSTRASILHRQEHFRSIHDMPLAP
ncbi:unnamed protein product [Dibothriocephalus latus]|uniref:Uncharacterized protein n=1 Tax=Dibothriocephalus latus TaxID=60516 RepID=A0A3P7NG08_DIBLA|nr:unnamed protein product [Dibothriocephalus latus]